MPMTEKQLLARDAKRDLGAELLLSTRQMVAGKGKVVAVHALTLQPINADVFSVHLADSAHVGNLKRIGAVWKFKAVGYDVFGAVEPGGGPLTDKHNLEFAQPDAAQVSAALLAPASTQTSI